MATIEKRVAALEGGRNGPFAHLTDKELDAEIGRLCVILGTSLGQEVVRHGSEHAFLTALDKEVHADAGSGVVGRGSVGRSEA